MSRTARWVLASGNRGKVAEIAALLQECAVPIELIAQAEFGVETPPEPALTFVENALLKARHAARLTGLPAIADDSGIAVDALGGAPGVLSARFAGPNADDHANVALLLESLANVPSGQRGATFHCVMVALRNPDDPAPIIVSGQWRGQIAAQPYGATGFGYDPIFLDRAAGKTAAQLTESEKNRVSHRGQALRQLAAELAARAE